MKLTMNVLLKYEHEPLYEMPLLGTSLDVSFLYLYIKNDPNNLLIGYTLTLMQISFMHYANYHYTKMI
uniref:Uncharacterized protein n=1 Tax=Romanomermis culicivorax TaxID=13658 RepID=A0A915K3U9_ROMCU